MNTCGLLGELCQLLLSGGVPADVLTETINTVAEIIRGNPPNQEYFGTLVAPSEPPRSATLVLIMSMANERQPFSMRLAALYCVECYLYKNEKGKREIIQTLLPSSTEGTYNLCEVDFFFSGSGFVGVMILANFVQTLVVGFIRTPTCVGRTMN